MNTPSSTQVSQDRLESFLAEYFGDDITQPMPQERIWLAEAIFTSDWMGKHNRAVRDQERYRLADHIEPFSKGAAAFIRFITDRKMTDADIKRGQEIFELIRAEEAQR